MTEIIHFNKGVDLRVADVTKLILGKKYLMVHNRPDDDQESYPPFHSLVTVTSIENTSFDEIAMRETGRLVYSNEHSQTKRWFVFYTTSSGFKTYICASDHGFTDSEKRAHTWNYVLDLEDLEARGITVDLEVSPGTDMTQLTDPSEDYWYSEYERDEVGNFE